MNITEIRTTNPENKGSYVCNLKFLHATLKQYFHFFFVFQQSNCQFTVCDNFSTV